MSNKSDIIAVLVADGLKINEAVKEALDDFLAIVDEENEEMQDDIDQTDTEDND